MESWVILGLGAALLFGTSTIAIKIASSPDYLGAPPSSVLILILAGIALVFVPYTAWISRQQTFSYQSELLVAGLCIGIFWALAQILVVTALNQNADVSRITPIFNLNTLVVVFLGILLLGELPDKAQAIRVVFGAVLIVAGGILVST
ncbi:MAG: EamA family transporter [Candidatus Altiarchaeota archaeon]